MRIFLSNVFNDPGSPWYYVIGVLFLVLIFGALAAYIILSKKKAKKDSSSDPAQKEDLAEPEQATDDADTNASVETDIPENKE